MAVYGLNFAATPGIPFNRVYPTNKDLFKFDGIRCCPYRLEMMWQHVSAAVRSLEWQPFKLLIKDEPLPVQKLEVGRFRLLFVGSVVDQIVDHMLYDDFNNAEIETFSSHPTKAGWVPQFGGYTQLRQAYRDPYSLDKSLWDWTAPGWVFDVEKEFRSMTVRADPEWERVHASRFEYCFERAKIVFTDGTIVEQTTPGLMKSGLLNTISVNSRAQLMLHLLASRRSNQPAARLDALGDDTLQEGKPTEEYISQLAALGPIVKQIKQGAEFGGTDLDTGVPLYWAKHVVTLLFSQNLEETLTSYESNYSLADEKLMWIQALMTSVGLCPTPTRVLRFRYAYGE